MNAFRVWVRPLEYEYVVRVDGLQNAQWLSHQLARSFVFHSAKPISQEDDSSLYTFQVPRDPFLSFSGIKKLLTAMPEVTLLGWAAAN